MRPGKMVLLGLCAPAMLIFVACDSGTPSGGPLQSPEPTVLTVTLSPEPTDAPSFPTDVARPTLTAVSILRAATTPSSPYWEHPDDLASADLDACTLLTEEEAEAATGLQLTQAKHLNQSTSGAKCRYEAESTAVSLKVFAPANESQAARVWEGRYRLYQDSHMSSFIQYAPGVGDAAFIYMARSAAAEFMTDRFWYIIAKRGAMYVELLWLTDHSEPAAALTEMMRKVVSRL